jgi:hypothetical protein
MVSTMLGIDDGVSFANAIISCALISFKQIGKVQQVLDLFKILIYIAENCNVFLS